MPRGPRLVYDNALVNITGRGNNKKVLFKRDCNYRYFKDLMMRYKKKHGLTIYHYCLMKNHIHMLLKIRKRDYLAKAMHGLQLAYSKYYNDRNNSCGRVWQGRFYSKLAEDDKYLLTAGLYIEANPVRAGIVATPEEYPWSSYRSYTEGIKDPLIELDPYYVALGRNALERAAAYKQIMVDYLKSVR